MYSSLHFTPRSASWCPPPTFPAELFAFLAVSQFGFVTESRNGEEVSKKSNLSVDAAAAFAAESLSQTAQSDSTSIHCLATYEETSFANRLYHSLLGTVDPAIHDNWSPWDCSVCIGPHDVSGSCALDHADRALLTSVAESDIPDYPVAGDVIGDYSLQLGDHIDEDAERVLDRPNLSISISGDGSPIGSARYLVAAAADAEWQQFLHWLQETTDIHWLCYLDIS